MVSWWLYLVGSTGGFTLGSFLLKRFADSGQLHAVAWSFLVLTLSNLLFVQVIRSGLGQGIVASSMMQVLLVAGLGVVVFNEAFSIVQFIGLAFAITSILLVFGAEFF